MTTTRRTFVEPRTATPDEAGWRFVAPTDGGSEPDRARRAAASVAELAAAPLVPSRQRLS